jgi:DNA-3-methyladenine glycosylase
MSAELLSVDPLTAARRLLGAGLTGRSVSAMIVEVEAYGGPLDGPWPDAASHSFRGLGGRNWLMFGPAGRLYTYRSHGIHVCANVVCATDGVAGAVLLRAAAVGAGIDVAQSRRGDSTRPAALARGPGNLCSALGVTMDDNGIDLFDAKSPVRLTLSEEHVGVDGPRVGVSKAADRPWRFWLAGRPEVSMYRRSPRAPVLGESD